MQINYCVLDIGHYYTNSSDYNTLLYYIHSITCVGMICVSNNCSFNMHCIFTEGLEYIVGGTERQQHPHSL